MTNQDGTLRELISVSFSHAGRYQSRGLNTGNTKGPVDLRMLGGVVPLFQCTQPQSLFVIQLRFARGALGLPTELSLRYYKIQLPTERISSGIRLLTRLSESITY